MWWRRCGANLVDMATAPVPHRPNLLLNVIGVLLIVGGIGMTLYGLLWALRVMQDFNPFQGDGPPFGIADGMAVAFWGIIVFTIGRYAWRGARKRGARDRVGRLLLVGGYVLLGVALDQGVHAGVRLWAARTSSGMETAVWQAILTFGMWAIPATVLAAIGVKMASERYLATASASASF